MPDPTTELYDITWTETSFCPLGDNPPARIVMWKRDPGLTDEEIEVVLRDVEAERSTTVTTMTKRSDVETEATRRAQELQKRDPETYGGKSLWAVRSAVYAQDPDLREKHEALPPEPVPVATSAPVHKAAAPFSKIDAAAREVLPDLYRRSPSMARSEVAKLRPDLQAAYHAGHGAR